MSKIEETIWNIVEPIIKENNFKLYDVEYVKEGAEYYLRIYIDNEESNIAIDDCEVVSRLVEPEIDKVDPIKEAYFLEISSPGVERVLRRPEHFEDNIGKQVVVKTFKPIEKRKQFEGELISFNDKLIINEDGTELSFDIKDVSQVRLKFEF